MAHSTCYERKYNPFTSFHWSFLFIIRERWRDACISITTLLIMTWLHITGFVSKPTSLFCVSCNPVRLYNKILVVFLFSLRWKRWHSTKIFFETEYYNPVWNEEHFCFLVSFSAHAKFTRWIAFLKTDTVMYLKNDNFHTRLSQPFCHLYDLMSTHTAT